jgi:hypothetical protein
MVILFSAPYSLIALPPSLSSPSPALHPGGWVGLKHQFRDVDRDDTHQSEAVTVSARLSPSKNLAADDSPETHKWGLSIFGRSQGLLVHEADDSSEETSPDDTANQGQHVFRATSPFKLLHLLHSTSPVGEAGQWDVPKERREGTGRTYKGFLRKIPAPEPIVELLPKISFCSSHSGDRGRWKGYSLT